MADTFTLSPDKYSSLLAAQAQLAVGAMGLPTLCEVVREERDDIEMLRGALDCLCLSVPASSDAHARRPQARTAGENPGIPLSTRVKTLHVLKHLRTTMPQIDSHSCWAYRAQRI